MSSMRMGPKAGAVIKASAKQQAIENAKQQQQSAKEESISVKEARRYKFEFHQIYENYVVHAFGGKSEIDWQAAKRMLLRACGAIATCDYQPPVDRDSKAVAMFIAKLVADDKFGQPSALGGSEVVPFIAGRVRLEQRMEDQRDSAARRRAIIQNLRNMGPTARARSLISWYDPRRR